MHTLAINDRLYRLRQAVTALEDYAGEGSDGEAWEALDHVIEIVEAAYMREAAGNGFGATDAIAAARIAYSRSGWTTRALDKIMEAL